MKKIIMITLSITLISGILLPAVVSATQPVSWTTESYRAYAYTDNISGTNPQSNEAFGPPLPVSANQYMGLTSAQSYIDSAYMTVFATTGSTSEISNAITEFTGSYTASNPGFVFTYSFPGYVEIGAADGWLTVTDTDSATVLFNHTFSGYATDAGTFTVNTLLGHNIEVNFGLNAFAHPFTSYDNARLDYSMGVAPEPASMILFATGGLMLAGRRKLKRKQHRQLA